MRRTGRKNIERRIREIGESKIREAEGRRIRKRNRRMRKVDRREKDPGYGRKKEKEKEQKNEGGR